MHRHLTIVAFAFLAACSATAPDDRAIQVISQSIPEPEISSDPLPLPAPVEITEAEPVPSNDTELCDARNYRNLVGQPAGGTIFPIGPELRVFGVDDIVTQEYVPQRTNIVADDSGTIVRVYCG